MSPFWPAELIATEANSPVATVPHIPPTPWQANTSRESSSLVRALQLATKLQPTPATTPITIENAGLTKPAAGVTAASPQTNPMHIPTAEGFPFRIQSSIIQLTPPAAAARFVVTRALTAMSFAERELPALNPNQPNQRIAVPRITYGTLLGRLSLPKSNPRPMTSAAASALTPAVV